MVIYKIPLKNPQKWTFILCIFLKISLLNNLYGQDNYQLIKDQYNNGNYTEVINLGRQFISKNKKNIEIFEVNFLMALSYYYLNKFLDANYACYQIINQYSTKKYDLDPVFYLKGITQLRNRSFGDAFIQFDKITNEKLKKKAAYLTTLCLDTLAKDSLDMVRKSYEKMPFWKLLQKDTLVINNINIEAVQKTNPWNIGVLMPYEAMNKNLFITELLNGIEIGKDSLYRRGIKLKLHLIESGKDSLALENAISKMNNQKLDMVIGPLYSTQVKKVVEWAKEKQVSVINPLSYQVYTDSAQNYFQFFPNYQNIGIEAAKFSFKNFTRKNKCVIIFSPTLADSTVAYNYKKSFENEGGQVLLIKSINKSQTQYMNALFNKIVIDSVGHIFAATSDAVLATNLFSTLEGILIEKAAAYKETLLQKMEEAKQAKTQEELIIDDTKKISVNDIPVIVPIEWLDFQAIGFDQFLLHETHFIHSKYINKNLEVTKNFESNYLAKYNNKPSYYAHIGYNLIIHFGSLIDMYGTEYYKINMDNAYFKLSTMGYIRYDKYNKNTYVPIVKIIDRELVLVNQPEEVK